MISKNKSNSTEITKNTEIIIQKQSGQFDILLTSKIDDNLSSNDVAVHYECILSIPETNYTEKKSVAVQSGNFKNNQWILTTFLTQILNTLWLLSLWNDKMKFLWITCLFTLL